MTPIAGMVHWLIAGLPSRAKRVRFSLPAPLLLLALLLLSLSCIPQAEAQTTQCITSVFGTGTPDAITSVALPCASTTNLVILYTPSANATSAPTYAPLGQSAQTIYKAGQLALAPGDLAAGGYAMLTPTGVYWELLNPSTVTGAVASLSMGTTGLTPSSPASGAIVVAGTLHVANGGTGATTASAARGNLLAARSGANTDITSLGGLTTPIAPTQGGTGENNGTATLSLAGAVSITGVSGGTLALGSGGNTYTFPNVSDTIAVLGTSQTFTAPEVFNSTVAPTLSGRALGIAGSIATPSSFGANGQGDAYVTAFGGITFAAQGSIHDGEWRNSLGNLAIAIPTGTVNTFFNGNVELGGSSTGYTALTTNNAGASNFTVTVPAITDTVALLAASQTLSNKTLNTPLITGSALWSGNISGAGFLGTIATGFDADFAANSNNDTTSSGTVAEGADVYVHLPTFTATNATTITNAASLIVGAPPTCSTNVTCTNRFSVWVKTGLTELDGAVNLGAAVTISPASGVVAINPTTTGSINNMVIGGSTPLAVTGTTLRANSGFSANGTAGVSTVCTETVGNTLTFTFGILTVKGANCT